MIVIDALGRQCLGKEQLLTLIQIIRCWVVERFLAWINRNRRQAKDFEATIDSARAFLYAASIMLLMRQIARDP